MRNLMFWKKETKVADSEKLRELEKRIAELECATEKHKIYEKDAWVQYWRLGGCWPAPAPIVSISLWDMMHKLREHVGLEIEATASTPATWKFVKKQKK
jgi:hypothetical protein